jgi:hypothetical protein
MLNWIILIAFHLNYVATNENQRPLLVTCGELIEHIYTTFIWWMKKYESKALLGIFTTGEETYESKVNKQISSELETDSTLRILINGIKKFLCEQDKKIYVDTTRAASPLTRRAETPILGTGNALNSREILLHRPISARSPRKSDSGTGSVRKIVNMFEPAPQGPASARPASPGPSAVKSETIPTNPSISRPFSASHSKGRPLTKTPRRPDTTSSNTPADIRHSSMGKQLQPYTENLFTISDNPAGSTYSDKLELEEITEKKMTEEEMKQARDDKEKILNKKDAARRRAQNTIANTENLRDNYIARNQFSEPSSKTYSIRNLDQATKNAKERQEERLNKGGKPRTRKHHRSANQQQLPRYTTIRKRSKHPVNQRRKYTRKARQDCVSGSTKRTTRVKNNLG